MKNVNKHMIKCLILGDPGVGKTALMSRYINNIFHESYKATIGADFLFKKIMVEDKEVSMQVWDTAGQERFQSLGVAFYRGTDVCVLVYDITEPNSFKNLDKWYKDFINNSFINEEDLETFPFMVVGNKLDRNSRRRISEGRAKQWCLENGIKHYIETSALSGENVESMFEETAKEAIENIERQKDKLKYIPPVINLEEETESSCCDR